VLATPHYDQNKLPKIESLNSKTKYSFPDEKKIKSLLGQEVVRVNVAWSYEKDSYEFKSMITEKSGTMALIARSANKDTMGSFHGELTYEDGSKAYDSVGTGVIYKYLTRAASFRFPKKTSKVAHFKLIAEDEKTGSMLTEIDKSLSKIMPDVVSLKNKLDIRLIKKSPKKNKIIITIYAEDYDDTEKDKTRFFTAAKKAVSELSSKSNIPNLEHFQYYAVFAASKEKISNKMPRGYSAGDPVKFKNSFLGLQHPYWREFGRWYHVVYPTSESHFRNALGQVKYDYPLVLVKSSSYWGVGNFNALTAIPDKNRNFTYLLLHEFGHFLGPNEEYEEGPSGRTELEFSTNLHEPWSPNMTFARDGLASLKWKHHLKPNTPLPTSGRRFSIGAFEGGYAGSIYHIVGATNYKPSQSCVMGVFTNDFCSVCVEGLDHKIKFDLGISNTKKRLKNNHAH
jgi:hypothetical protein